MIDYRKFGTKSVGDTDESVTRDFFKNQIIDTVMAMHYRCN